MTCIGEKAFFKCCKLTSVILGKNVVSINKKAFGGCTDVSEIKLTGLNPDYYSFDEDEPSFEPNARLTGFEEEHKTFDAWVNYKEEKISSIKVGIDGREKDTPYYWTDSLEDELYLGTGKFADHSIFMHDKELVLSINGRKYMSTPYETDPDAQRDNMLIRTGIIVCREGELGDLKYIPLGYKKNIIQAKLTKDDGIEENIFFTNGSEEAVLEINKN